jgi:hypothetical protein
VATEKEAGWSRARPEGFGKEKIFHPGRDTLSMLIMWTINAQVTSVTTSELEIKKHDLYILFPGCVFRYNSVQTAGKSKGRTFISLKPPTTFTHSTHDKLYTENN